MLKGIFSISLIGVFLVILGWYLMFSIIDNGISSIQNDKNSADKLIGKEVVIKQDTLMITDYSMLDQTYTLNNGQKINKNLAPKILLKKVK